MRNNLLVSISVLLICLNINKVNASDRPEPTNIKIENQCIQTIHHNLDENEEHLKSPVDKKKYRVGVSYVNGYPLFAFADLEDRGFGWAILEKFAIANNIEFEYSPMPITRLQPSMDSGAIDFIFPDNPLWTLYRSNRLPNIYSGAVMSAVGITFVSQENSEMELSQVKKVSIPFGYTAYTWLDPIQQHNIKTMPVRDLSTALYSVVQRTSDAADVEYNIGQYLISKNPSLTNAVINTNLPNVKVDYHLSSIKHIVLLEKLTTFVEQEAVLIECLRAQYGIKYHHEVVLSN